jgi:hypothetical protein
VQARLVQAIPVFQLVRCACVIPSEQRHSGEGRLIFDFGDIDKEPAN